MHQTKNTNPKNKAAAAPKATASTKPANPSSPCSPWLANLSNKALPPAFFLLIGISSLLIASHTSSDIARLNLGVLSAFSSVMGFYFLGS